MANAEFSIRLDEDEIREQVTKAVSEALEEAGWKLRAAADALQPDFWGKHDAYWEEEVERRVKERLND